MAHKTEIMDENAMNRAIARIAHEIIEKNQGIDNMVILGVHRRGVPIAKRIAERIAEVEKKAIQVGILDITFYRDDLSLLAEHPVLNGTTVDFPIKDKKIILVDDVLYTGRTVRAAIEAIMDMGRPTSISLAVLIDRGHRELPIKADYIGKNVPTSKNEVVSVKVKEFDAVDSVTISDLVEDSIK